MRSTSPDAADAADPEDAAAAEGASGGTLGLGWSLGIFAGSEDPSWRTFFFGDDDAARGTDAPSYSNI